MSRIPVTIQPETVVNQDDVRVLTPEEKRGLDFKFPNVPPVIRQYRDAVPSAVTVTTREPAKPTDEGGESILQEAHRLTHGTRNKDYGHPLDDYTRTAALISALFAHKLKEPLIAEEAALIQCCVKLSRHTNAPKRDNMTDLAGYAWVVWACAEERARRANPLLPVSTKESTAL